ncbi:CIR protein PIR protein [Plasmodium vinckei lentum]|uniref:CIR protein PIR protein n=1 Tax=Plasmodium vinckei lentum TaxID=138297 RepID=A0A6V7T430_PLAVN|nr:CIR protein PIR protein [Plasmodium vinckei lentum]
MAQSSYSIENVYKEINTIDDYFGIQNGGNVEFSRGPIHKYCHYRNTSGNDKCRDYLEMASSGVIYVLNTLKDKHRLEDDKLAEYAILWLRYKLNQKAPYYNTQLNNFYTNYIEKNKYYNNKIKDNGSMTYKDIIDKKKDLMDIKEMTKFSYPFKILLFLYNETNKNSLNCTKPSTYLKAFADEFDKLNKDSNNVEDSSYNKMLSRLSDDYNYLKNKYGNNNSCNFPSLPEIEPKKNIAQNPVGKSVKDSGHNSLESSVKGSGQILEQTSEVTSSSSSILSTLIPALSVVSVILVFLGIAYKYSLFGIDKLFQRQYLRKKLKKVKKKMKLNI